MKKLIAMLLALAMVLTFAACGKKDDAQPTEGTKETQAAEQQAQPTEQEEVKSNTGGKITLDDLMNAPESPESDFEVFDYGEGTVEIVGYLGSDEIVVIPATWKGKEITSIASYVFSNSSPVKAIRLSNSIKIVNDGAFGLNENLQIFVAGSGLEEICMGAFQNCYGLTDVVLNDGLVKLGEYAFSGLAMHSIEIPSSVTEMDATTFYSVSDDFVIIGEAGSYAEEYAANEGITFKAK